MKNRDLRYRATMFANGEANWIGPVRAGAARTFSARSSLHGSRSGEPTVFYLALRWPEVARVLSQRPKFIHKVPIALDPILVLKYMRESWIAVE